MYSTQIKQNFKGPENFHFCSKTCETFSRPLKYVYTWAAGFNTGPFGNNTSVDPKGQQEPDVVALVGDPKALNQEETNNVDESTKPNETPNERSIINKKYLEKKQFIKDYRKR